MRKVDPRRFLNKKPEEIEFQGEYIPDTPPLKPQEESSETGPTDARPEERTDGRSDARTDRPATEKPLAAETGNFYTVTIPGHRRKIRHPFDIYEDQLVGLKKLQIAVREEASSKNESTLGDMTRKALDNYLEKESKRSNKIRLIRELQADQG